jgi:RNA polymerase sigma factor (sigma-70 family)
MSELPEHKSMNDQNQVEQLLEAYYTGDDVTVEQLFIAFGEHLTFFANAILNDFNKAKDAVQDVMIKLLETPVELRREKFRPNTNNILGALKMRVRNRSIDIIRQQKRYKEVTVETVFDLGTESAESQEFIIGDELKMALKVLEPLEKSVLKSHLEGYNNSEIESMYPLECSVRVIKQRVKRKLKREILKLRNFN